MRRLCWVVTQVSDDELAQSEQKIHLVLQVKTSNIPTHSASPAGSKRNMLLDLHFQSSGELSANACLIPTVNTNEQKSNLDLKVKQFA